MRRRLPLLGVPGAAEPLHALDPLAQPLLPLGRGSVGVADTGSGLLAAELAVELALELGSTSAGAGTRVALILLGYQGVPALPDALMKRLAAGQPAGRRALVRVSTYAIDAGVAHALPRGLSLEPDELALWVGLPALCSFAPALALLLGADRSVSLWPAALRARRPRCALALSQNRPGFARSLAAALNEHGFLLRR